MAAVVRKRLGELLLELGLIDQDQLTSALAYQRQWGHRLGVSLVAKGFIAEGTLTAVLSRALGIPMLDLSGVTPDRDALRLVPVSTAEAQALVPVTLEGSKPRRTLVIAMSDPLNLVAVEQLEFTTGCKIKVVIAGHTSVGQAIRAWMKGERVMIQPASYGKPGTPGGQPPQDDEPMTILRPGGEEAQLSGSHATLPAQPRPPAYPFAQVPHSGAATAPSGSFQVPFPTTSPGSYAPPAPQHDPVEDLERKFWALMRVLARKGLITKEEFLKEWQAMG